MNNENQKIRAAVYARFSSDNQREESIDAQVRAANDYAKRNNMEIVKVFADHAKSATSDKRPEFQRMIEESGKDMFDVIIVHKLDRFSRDKYDSVTYKRKLKRNGVRVISVLENLDGSPESTILESLLEGMSEYYSQNLAREVMKGMIETAHQCKHTGGSPPLGYDVNPITKKYEINENEASIIKTIFSLFLDGYGYNRIIRILNDLGFKTKRGRPFGKNSLHDLLCNEKYAGVYVYNRSASKDAFGLRNTHKNKNTASIIRIEGGMPAIISKEDFEQVTKKMQVNKKRPGSNKAKHVYLLSGLIYCGECGSAMQGNSRSARPGKPKFVSYRCGKRDRTLQCDNKEIRRESIEWFVLNELERTLFNDDAIPYLVEKLNEYQNKVKSQKQDEFSLYTKRLSEIQSQIDNIVQAIANGFTQDTFKAQVDKLEEEKKTIETRLHEHEVTFSKTIVTADSMRKMFSMFKQFVRERNIPECKKFIDSYVEKVLVFNDRLEVKFKVVFSSAHTNHPYTFVSRIKTIKLSRQFKKAI